MAADYKMICGIVLFPSHDLSRNHIKTVRHSSAMTTTSISLPCEIIDYILGYIKDDKSTLSNFSLVAREWVAVARYHLFSTIRLSSSVHDVTDTTGTSRYFSYVARFLDESPPGSLECIRELTIVGIGSQRFKWAHAPFIELSVLASMVKRIPLLSFLKLRNINVLQDIIPVVETPRALRSLVLDGVGHVNSDLTSLPAFPEGFFTLFHTIDRLDTINLRLDIPDDRIDYGHRSSQSVNMFATSWILRATGIKVSRTTLYQLHPSDSLRALCYDVTDLDDIVSLVAQRHYVGFQSLQTLELCTFSYVARYSRFNIETGPTDIPSDLWAALDLSVFPSLEHLILNDFVSYRVGGLRSLMAMGELLAGIRAISAPCLRTITLKLAFFETEVDIKHWLRLRESMLSLRSFLKFRIQFDGDHSGLVGVQELQPSQRIVAHTALRDLLDEGVVMFEPQRAYF